MPKLVIREGEDVRDVYLKDGDTLGRVAQNAIVLKVAEASRTHCKFTREKDAWFVEDQGSSNGTLVNGRKVTKFELQDGDEISIGKATMRFLDAEEPAVTAAPAAAWGDDDISLEEKHFLVLGGAGRAGEVVMLPEGSVTVGRNARHHLILKDASVSGDHAELRRSGSECELRDVGSSNGTYVNGRKCSQATLEKGDVVRFGSIEATYGVGDPKDFTAPGGGSESAEFTRTMDSSELADDTSFEFSAAVPKSEKIWNLVSLGVILLLGGAVAWLLTRATGSTTSGTRALDRGANLIADHAWSFEAAPETVENPPQWLRGDEVSSASGSESPEWARSGRSGFHWSRSEAAAPLSFVALSEVVPLSPDTPYLVRFSATGEGALAVMGLAWMTRGEGEQGRAEIGRTWFNLRPKSATEWSEYEATVWPPAGADAATVLVGALGQGEVALDDLFVLTGSPPAGSTVDAAPFRACLDPVGTMRLLRYGRTVIDGVGVSHSLAGGLTAPQAELWVPSASPQGGVLTGSLLHGLGDLRARLEPGEGKFRFALEGQAVGKAGLVTLPLVPRAGVDLEVTVLDGETGRRYTTDFAGLPATALIVGSGDDRARVDFVASGGAAQRLNCNFDAKTGRLSIVATGLDAVDMSFRLAFEKDEEDATALLRQATTASREGKSGTALALLDDLRARFPFATRIVADASRLESEIQEAGKSRVAALKRRAEDAIFFRTLSRDTTLFAELGAERARYSGTSLGSQFDEIATAASQALESSLAPGRTAEANRRLLRAKAYEGSGKRVLTELLAASIVSGFPSTEAATEAKALIDRLRSKPEGER